MSSTTKGSAGTSVGCAGSVLGGARKLTIEHTKQENEERLDGIALGSSKKRSRTVDPSDDMYEPNVEDAVEVPPSTQKRQRTGKESMKVADIAVLPTVLEGSAKLVPSSASLLFSHNLPAPKVSELPSLRASYATEQAVDVDVDALSERTLRDHRRILELKEKIRLADERHFQECQKLQQDKQSMLLDTMMREKEHSRQLELLRREKVSLRQCKEAREQEVKKQDAQLVKERLARKEICEAMRFQHRKELETLNERIEHLETVNRTLEEDLDNLRQLEHERTASKHKRPRGLPPAYESLQKEKNRPPYMHHQDRGSFRDAALVDAAGDHYLNKLSDAYDGTNAPSSNTPGEEKKSTNSYTFYRASCNLKRACRNIQLERHHVDTVASDYDPFVRPTADNRDWFPTTSRAPTLREDTAVSIVKLVLDLGWRVVSVCALRPGKIELEAEQKTQIGIAYNEIDETMLNSLRHAFYHQPGHRDLMLFDLQHYYSQIDALRSALRQLRTGANIKFFPKSQEWLTEQVEVERANRAQRPTQPA